MRELAERLRFGTGLLARRGAKPEPTDGIASSPPTPERMQEILAKIRGAPKYGAGVDCTPNRSYNNEVAVRCTHAVVHMHRRHRP